MKLTKLFDKVYYADDFPDKFAESYGNSPSYPYDKEEFDARYDLLTKELVGMKDNQIYRAVVVDSVEDIDWGSIGLSWTYDPEMAIPYWGNDKSGGTVVLVGKASAQNVDVLETLSYHLTEIYEESEKEIRLKENAPIQILGLYTDGKLKELKKKASTGSDPLKKAHSARQCLLAALKSVV